MHRIHPFRWLSIPSPRLSGLRGLGSLASTLQSSGGDLQIDTCLEGGAQLVELRSSGDAEERDRCTARNFFAVQGICKQEARKETSLGV